MIIRLSSIACARSGDKGNNANIGVIFNNKSTYNWAIKNLTEEIVANYFKKIIKGNVSRYKLDNLNALNFVLYESLGGGGSESLLNDAQGKTYGQYLLMMEIDLPDKLKEFINE